jgi:TetR/AcrR family transcriptional regulator
MADPRPKGSRKEHILQVLAQLLEHHPGGRITTSALAKQVGVSEAALYRHFPSKARMFEDLITFMEDTLFSRINRIISNEPSAQQQCERIILLVLTFSEKNPGISRILNGDALAGENARLRSRVSQIFDRLESQLRQILRDAELREGLRTQISNAATAHLLIACIEGKISQYVRTDFKRRPTENWQDHWQFLQLGLFRALQE